MPQEPLHRLPDDVIVPLGEIRWVVQRLEQMAGDLERRSRLRDLDAGLEEIIGRIVRWLWRLLDELDRPEA